MLVRAFICCTALILGLLATLGATAQSAGACNGAACRPAEKSRPLDLMSFMRGRAKTDARTDVRTNVRPGRQSAAKTATHSPKSRQAGGSTARSDNLPDAAPETLPAAAAAAYAAEPNEAQRDVQVVTGDQLNAIDLAMLRAPAETVGAAPRIETDEPRESASNPAKVSATAPRVPGLPRDDPPRDVSLPRDDSWIGRFWAAIGDRFVVLVAMVRQLLA